MTLELASSWTSNSAHWAERGPFAGLMAFSAPPGMPIPRPDPGPPQSFNLPQASFYPTVGNLQAYYASIHNYMLALNDLLSTQKGKSCFNQNDLTAWRRFRDSWVAFYSAGPSTWWTWFSSDATIGLQFQQQALQWEAFIVQTCGARPLSPGIRPLGTPTSVGDVMDSLTPSVPDFGIHSGLEFVGLSLLGLGVLYVAIKALKF